MALRKRVFTYQWCGRTETDYVCTHCETIVLDPAKGCQHCKETDDKAKARIAALLAKKKAEVQNG